MSSGQIQPAEVNQRIEAALGMNEWLASCYHRKYRYISRDEFLSAGLVGIAKANNRFPGGNWAGYVKVAIQRTMIDCSRRYTYQQKIKQKAWRFYNPDEALYISGRQEKC